MRTLMLTPDFPPGPGGIQILAHRVAAHAARLESRVVTIRRPGADRFDAAQEFTVRRTREISRSHRAEVLLLSTAAVREAARFRPRAVLNMHIVTAPASRAIARLFGIPYVQYLHASEVDYRPRLAGFAVKGAAATVAVSAHTAHLARQAGAAPESVHVIAPGVDLREPMQGPRPDPPTLITVSRLDDRYKGHDIVLRALARVLERAPGARWIVIGEGALRAELEREARRLGLEEHVSFLGAVSDDERDAQLGRAHVFAMPSRRPPEGGGEGFGIAYLEAGVSGLPVVAGDAAGTPDAVLHNETGVLVDPEDPKAVGDAIADLLLDRDRAQALGRRGRERAADYAWPVVAQKVERLLLDLRRT